MHRHTLITALTTVTFAFCANGAQAAPASDCDLVAAPTGVAGAVGTVENPLRSVIDVVNGLSDGETGCFAAGTYPVGNYTIAKPGITLTSLDGQQAEIKGRLWIKGDGITLEGLVLNNENTADLPSSITGDDVVLRDNEITNHHTTICFNVGNAAYGRAQDTLIEGNRIHDCGRLPASNFDHGIYIEDSDGVVIRDNWIYGNADRGIQLYPDADGTLIERNVIDRNGEGIIFGGSPEDASDDTIVRNNLITNSKLRDNVESAYGPGEPVGQNNLVTNNCISGGAYDNGDGGILKNAEGFTAHSNLIERPVYTNAAAGDYTLKPGSPCAALLENGEPPVEEDPPAEDPPAEDPPAEDPPAEDPPAEDPPAEDPPAEDPPAEDPPAEDPVDPVEPSLSLESAKTEVKKGTTLQLRGEAVGVTTVAILRKSGEDWVEVATVDAGSGDFTAAVHAAKAGRKTFKAVAADTETAPVQVKVRRH
jgi:parallel beta-helix repeat protein